MQFHYEVWFRHAVTGEWYDKGVCRFILYSEAMRYQERLRKDGLTSEIREIRNHTSNDKEQSDAAER